MSGDGKINGNRAASRDPDKPEFRIWFVDGRVNVIQAVIGDRTGKRDSQDAAIITVPGEPGLMLCMTPDEAEEMADYLKEIAQNIRIKWSAEDKL